MLAIHRSVFIGGILWMGLLAQRSDCLRKEDAIASLGGSQSRAHVESVEMTVGSSFASRYQLLGLLNQVPLRLGELPDSLKKRFGKIHGIGSGTFGEVWKALDTATNEYVVIKFFIATFRGVGRYLTWQLAGHDPNLLSCLRHAVQECQTSIDMQFFARMSPTDVVASSHILKCKEDHVRMPLSATGHTVGSTDVVYHIFEFVGDYTLDEWMQRALVKDSASQYVDRCLRLLKQLLLVLHYFSSHDIKWVHHDLKPSNIVVRTGVDGFDHLTVIDLGSATEFSENNANRSLVATLEYSPFEGWDVHELARGRVTARGYDAKHISSFDIYSVGVIFYEIITGHMLVEKMVDAELTESEILDMGRLLHTCYTFRHVSAKLCRRVVVFYAAGRPGGCAQRFLSHFSEEVMGTSDDTHRHVSAVFQDLAKETSWYNTFRRIIAYDPSDRATPLEVLASNLLKSFTFEDPVSVFLNDASVSLQGSFEVEPTKA